MWSKVRCEHFYTTMFKIWKICACVSHYYWLIRRYTCWYIGSMVDVMKVAIWTFLEIISDIQLFTDMAASAKAMRLKFVRNKFGKKMVFNWHTRKRFRKATSRNWWSHWSTSFMKEYPQLNFRLHIISGSLSIVRSNKKWQFGLEDMFQILNIEVPKYNYWNFNQSFRS